MPSLCYFESTVYDFGYSSANSVPTVFLVRPFLISQQALAFNHFSVADPPFG
jgi:hypothetical protein